MEPIDEYLSEEELAEVMCKLLTEHLELESLSPDEMEIHSVTVLEATARVECLAQATIFETDQYWCRFSLDAKDPANPRAANVRELSDEELEISASMPSFDELAADVDRVLKMELISYYAPDSVDFEIEEVLGIEDSGARYTVDLLCTIENETEEWATQTEIKVHLPKEPGGRADIDIIDEMD